MPRLQTLESRTNGQIQLGYWAQIVSFQARTGTVALVFSILKHAITKHVQTLFHELYLISVFLYPAVLIVITRFYHGTENTVVNFIFSEPKEQAKEPDTGNSNLSLSKQGVATSENTSHDEIQRSCQQLIDDINAKRKRDTDLLNGTVYSLNVLSLLHGSSLADMTPTSLLRQL